MEKSANQIEKNVSASFGYVKKDMLMLNDAFSDLHDKMQHLSMNHAGLLEEIGRLRAKIASLEGKRAPSKKIVKKIVVKKSPNKKEDLTKVEGIGPAIKNLLWKNKIDTYKILGDKTPEELRAILDRAGPKFQMHNPSTWPRQARMAAAGEWKELKELQDKLKGGLFEKKVVKKKAPANKKEVKKVVKETTTYG
ncbi:MAG: hypothetical protein NUV97_03420 [archaeon]|nr:hypothetical protein [archaeon]MCR4323570.1 hypothetical protein [Nanoarchaeota archaeon]